MPGLTARSVRVRFPPMGHRPVLLGNFAAARSRGDAAAQASSAVLSDLDAGLGNHRANGNRSLVDLMSERREHSRVADERTRWRRRYRRSDEPTAGNAHRARSQPSQLRLANLSLFSMLR